MNKLVQKAACIALLAALMGGCSMNDKKDANTKTNETKEAAEKSVKDAKNKTEDSIDNVMNYFKDKGLKYENSKAITDIDFAAYEGRSFDYNGSTGYLYRVKSDDDNMKKVLKEAKDNGKVKVSINNKEQEYGAKVNGDSYSSTIPMQIGMMLSRHSRIIPMQVRGQPEPTEQMV